MNECSTHLQNFIFEEMYKYNKALNELLKQHNIETLTKQQKQEKIQAIIEHKTNDKFYTTLEEYVKLLQKIK